MGARGRPSQGPVALAHSWAPRIPGLAWIPRPWGFLGGLEEPRAWGGVSAAVQTLGTERGLLGPQREQARLCRAVWVCT